MNDFQGNTVPTTSKPLAKNKSDKVLDVWDFCCLSFLKVLAFLTSTRGGLTVGLIAFMVLCLMLSLQVGYFAATVMNQSQTGMIPTAPAIAAGYFKTPTFFPLFGGNPNILIPFHLVTNIFASLWNPTIARLFPSLFVEIQMPWLVWQDPAFFAISFIVIGAKALELLGWANSKDSIAILRKKLEQLNKEEVPEVNPKAIRAARKIRNKIKNHGLMELRLPLFAIIIGLTAEAILGWVATPLMNIPFVWNIVIIALMWCGAELALLTLIQYNPALATFIKKAKLGK